MPISVAIIEDNPDIRMGTSYILRSSRSCTVAGEYGSAEEFFDAYEENLPDVILMDLGLPGMSGIQAIERLKREHSRIEIVVQSIYQDDDNVFKALCAGANGYIAKPVLPQQLLEAVEDAFSGGTPMSPRIARKVLEIFKQHAPSQKTDFRLTPRELEVLQLLVQGEDYKSVAQKLFLSLFTVRAHVRNIYDKLHVHTKSQAVAKALRENVLPPR
jgi:DNA-binding NarL/FixJ family response regulator